MITETCAENGSDLYMMAISWPNREGALDAASAHVFDLTRVWEPANVS